MVVENVELDELVEQLMAVLDEDAAQIRSTLARLDALRAAVIKRDEETLRSQLEAIQEESECSRRIEMKRQRIRRQLAEILGCDIGSMNLSALCSVCAPEQRRRIRRQQEQLGRLAGEFRMAHTYTTILLRECSRLNRMLLRQIVGQSAQTVTYTARGHERWDVHDDMVNMRM